MQKNQRSRQIKLGVSPEEHKRLQADTMARSALSYHLSLHGVQYGRILLTEYDASSNGADRDVGCSKN
eukprot:550175-Amphidinium_carterae.1